MSRRPVGCRTAGPVALRVLLVASIAWGIGGCAGSTSSFPAFWEELARATAGGTGPPPTGSRPGGGGGGDASSADPDDPMATVVTIDGPAGSGKSTTARAVAGRLGWRYLDSGALYRALTHALLEAGTPPERWSGLDASELGALGVEVELGPDAVRVLHRGELLDDELRRDAVTEHVSRLAALPAVREWLLGAQRAAGRRGRLVADGRDMGTVVFPRAGTKVFLDATPRERARRRLSDKGVEEPDETTLEEERERLRARDRRDSEREHSPLRIPDGALVLDTTDLDFEEQVERIVELAEARR